MCDAPRRPESRIAVVSHCGFIFLMLSAFGHECAHSVQEEMHRGFDNCEMRSMVRRTPAGPPCDSPDRVYCRKSVMSRMLDFVGRRCVSAPTSQDDLPAARSSGNEEISGRPLVLGGGRLLELHTWDLNELTVCTVFRSGDH